MPTPILMPRQGQSVESCILTEWLVKPGDAVDEGAPVANIETDKATFEVEAPSAGTILELFFEEGDDIPVLTHIAAIGDAGEDASSLRPDGAAEAASPTESGPAEPPTPEPEPAPSAASAPAPAPSAGPATGISPRARRRAADSGIRTDGLAGSGPGGRVIERDVIAAESSQPRLSAAARDVAAGAAVPAAGSGPAGMVLAADLGTAAPDTPAPAPGAVTEIKVSGVRKIIGERMKASLQGTAQLTLHRGFNAEPLLAYRAKVKAAGEAMGLPNITVNDLIVYAVSRVLPRHPALNAHFLGTRILQFADVNIGIAVDTPRGLMVPVLKQANHRSLRGLSEAIRPLAAACLEGSPNPDDLSGGTFTITNLGALGIETFTPVLNAPEVGILGVGGLTWKPVADADGVKHVQSIDLSLTIDHQAVDGAPGARFLGDLVTALENIELALAG